MKLISIIMKRDKRIAQLEAELDATVQLSEAKNDRLNTLEAENRQLKADIKAINEFVIDALKEGG